MIKARNIPKRPPPCDTLPNGSIACHVRDILSMVRRDGGVTVDECIHELGRSSIILGLLMFSFLSSLPLFSIPGFTTITGIPIVLLGAQLLTAREYIWLPRRIRKKRLESERLWRTMQLGLPGLRKMERWLAPRILPLSESPARNILGALFVITGTVLALPIPFVNFPAGFSMFVLAVGLVARDGFVILLGVAMISVLLTLMLLTFNGALALAF